MSNSTKLNESKQYQVIIRAMEMGLVSGKTAWSNSGKTVLFADKKEPISSTLRWAIDQANRVELQAEMEQARIELEPIWADNDIKAAKKAASAAKRAAVIAASDAILDRAFAAARNGRLTDELSAEVNAAKLNAAQKKRWNGIVEYAPRRVIEIAAEQQARREQEARWAAEKAARDAAYRAQQAQWVAQNAAKKAHIAATRVMMPYDERPAVGETFWISDDNTKIRVCTGYSKNPWLLSQDQIDDNDDFHLEGVYLTYVYFEERTVSMHEALEIRIERRDAEANSPENLARIEAEQKTKYDAWVAAHIEGLDSVYLVAQRGLMALPGVDWQFAIKSGDGHYAVSYYVAHTENGETVYRRDAGTESVYYAPRAVADAWIESEWQKRIPLYGGAARAALKLLELHDKNSGWYGGYGERDVARLIEIHGAAHFEALARSEEIVAAPAQPKYQSPDAALIECAARHNVPVTQLAPLALTPELKAQFKTIIAGRLPLGADVRDLCAGVAPDGRRFAEVSFSVPPGSYRLEWVNMDALAPQPVVHPVAVDFAGIRADYSGYRESAFRQLAGLSIAASFKFLRYPDGRTVAALPESARELDLSNFDIAALDRRAAQIKTEKTDKQAAKKLEEWRALLSRCGIENAVWLAGMEELRPLDHAEHGSGMNGQIADLDELRAFFDNAPAKTLYRVAVTHWNRGEDADVDTQTQLFEDEGAARARFRQWSR